MDLEAAKADLKRQRRREQQERERAIDPAVVNDATPLDAALYYARKGYPVMPLHEATPTGGCTCGRDGCDSQGKHPRTAHGFKEATTDPATIREWFTRWPDANVGIRTGPESGTWVIDVDPRHGGLDSQEQIGAPFDTLTAKTGSGGFHYVFKHPGSKVKGNRGLLPGIDLRGDGGLIVVAPSRHVSGGRYQWDTTRPRTPQPAPASALSIIPKHEPHEKPKGWVRPPSVTPRPGDGFNALVDPARVLEPHGWTLDHADGDVLYLTRPGKDSGVSATFNAKGDGKLYVYSQAPDVAPLEPDRPYDLFAAWTVLEHGGDFTEAAKAAKEMGFGAQPPPGGSEEEAPPDDAWALTDVGAVLDAGLKPPVATMLLRTDATGLLYPGKIHAIAAEPEAGKSWLALVACVERMEAGETVLYVDFEADPYSVIERLDSLGVPHDRLRRQFLYIRPEGQFSKKLQAWLAGIIADRKPNLVVLDGVAEAMVMEGLDESINPDVVKFFETLPRFFERKDCTVITIDHVTKATEGGRRYARGGGHKLAGTSVAFRIESAKPFGRGMAGMSKVYVTKDRPGGIRARAVGSGLVAEFHLDSTGEYVVPELRAPEATTRPTYLMRMVSRTLMEAGTPLNITAIREAVTGKNEHIRWALQVLVSEGYVDTLTDEKRGTVRYKHVRPFTEDDRGTIAVREPAAPRIGGRWVPLPQPPLASLNGGDLDGTEDFEAEWLAGKWDT